MEDKHEKTIESEILDLQFEIRRLTQIGSFIAAVIMLMSIAVIVFLSYFTAAFRVLPSDVQESINALQTIAESNRKNHDDFDKRLDRLIRRIDALTIERARAPED